MAPKTRQLQHTSGTVFKHCCVKMPVNRTERRRHSPVVGMVVDSVVVVSIVVSSANKIITFNFKNDLLKGRKAEIE